MSCKPERHEWKLTVTQLKPRDGTPCLCGAVTFNDDHRKEREAARRFAAEHDGCVDRSRAERAEKRCADLQDTLQERGATIEALRSNLADANAREANHKCPDHLDGALRYVLHTCPPPLGNPTREEAIAQRDAAVAALRRLQATGQSIVDVAKNGMKQP